MLVLGSQRRRRSAALLGHDAQAVIAMPVTGARLVSVEPQGLQSKPGGVGVLLLLDGVSQHLICGCVRLRGTQNGMVPFRGPS